MCKMCKKKRDRWDNRGGSVHSQLNSQAQGEGVRGKIGEKKIKKKAQERRKEEPAVIQHIINSF